MIRQAGQNYQSCVEMLSPHNNASLLFKLFFSLLLPTVTEGLNGLAQQKYLLVLVFLLRLRLKKHTWLQQSSINEDLKKDSQKNLKCQRKLFRKIHVRRYGYKYGIYVSLLKRERMSHDVGCFQAAVPGVKNQSAKSCSSSHGHLRLVLKVSYVKSGSKKKKPRCRWPSCQTHKFKTVTNVTRGGPHACSVSCVTVTNFSKPTLYQKYSYGHLILWYFLSFLHCQH